MRAALASLAVLAGAPSAGSALSCARPADLVEGADLVVFGEVVRVDAIRTFKRTPWPSGDPVTLTEYAAQVRPTKVLRGAAAPQQLSYRFRNKKVNCDTARSVRPGEQVVIAVAWADSSRPEQVWALSPVEYDRLASGNPR